MTDKVFVVSTTNPKHRYEVVGYDKETKMGTLKGPVGVPFEKSLAPDDLKKAGYTIQRGGETPSAKKPANKPADDDDDD